LQPVFEWFLNISELRQPATQLTVKLSNRNQRFGCISWVGLGFGLFFGLSNWTFKHYHGSWVHTATTIHTHPTLMQTTLHLLPR
jgi:hypothetical protein